MPRFVKEYANYVIARLESTKRFIADLKEYQPEEYKRSYYASIDWDAVINHIKATVQMCEAQAIVPDEAMRTISDIDYSRFKVNG